MTKYATFDANSVLNGRYDDEINGDIPVGAVPITAEEFERSIQETDGIWKRVDGSLQKTAFQSPSQSAIDAAWNASIDAQLMAADLKIIRALTEGDTARVSAHKTAQAALRATRR